MENNQNQEKIYELLEQFSFDELSESNKQLILSVISEEEYRHMYTTLNHTKEYYQNHSEIVSNQASTFHKKGIAYFLKYPLQLYKVAASFLILATIALLWLSKPSEKDLKLTSTIDTVYIKTIDTVLLTKYETVEKENHSFTYRNINKTITHTPENTTDIDSISSINPEDIDAINEMAVKTSLKYDSSLIHFIVSTN